MNDELISEVSTLDLVKELIDAKQTYVEISKSKWWQVWRKGHRLEELSRKSQANAREISIRYKGILWQLACWAKDDHLTASEWENCQTSIWQLVNDHARTMSNYRNFSGVLWNISSRQFAHLGDISSLSLLRPKFMLRQFVDEMTNSDARGLLRALAFGEELDSTPKGRELINAVDRAMPVLHMHVLSKIDDVSALTDGEITAEMVRPFKEPFQEYKDWLFGKSRKDND